MCNTKRQSRYSAVAILVAILLLSTENIRGQQYDAQWVLGDRESVLDFRNDTLVNYPIEPLMPMFLTSANICDSSGNLLYYTNGIYIADKDGNKIENGDTLSPCNYTYQYYWSGLNIPQATLFIPKPGNDRYYYLFHMSNDTVNDGRPGNLYYTLIDRTGNIDSGSATEKNIVFGKGIFREGGFTACKHANGRDWWLVMGSRNSNKYYKFLLTPEGIFGPFVQAIGHIYLGPFDIMRSKFSQDGSKYVTGSGYDLITLMDFDRCTGEFSNPITIFNQACEEPTSCSGIAGAEFSPNSRFLYLNNSIDLNQYDLINNDPQHDSLSIWHYNSSAAKMDFMQLAPNGKIYACCFNGGYYFIHAINYPDIKGDSCMFVDTAFTTLTANSLNLPNMVNYQLGPLVGSECDTLTDVKNEAIENRLLRVLPNPADKYLYVEMGQQGDYEFQFLNEAGQIIETKQTRQVDIFDTEKLPAGVYFLNALDRNSSGKIVTRKIVIQH